MNITCPHCTARLNLPDNKVPRDRGAAFKCPRCRESVPVKAARRPAAPEVRRKAVKGVSLGRTGQALVCMPASPVRQQVAAAVMAAGYAAETPGSTADALDRLEYRTYPLVVLDDAFDTGREVARYLDEMDMSLRRRICLVRVSTGVSTGDPMAALHSSANCVVNRRHLEEDGALAGEILAAALEEHHACYRVFNEALKAAGKA